MIIAITIYVLFCSIGLTALALILGPLRIDPRLVLASPAIGASTLLLATTFLNRVGNLPARQIAPAIAIVSSLSIIYAGYVLSKIKGGYAKTWFLAIGVLGALMAGWPILQFGPDWISYANDDMVNYSLSAEWLMDHGLRSPPDFQGFVFNKNASAAFWTYYLYERHGVDELLALCASIFRVNAIQAFMPVILALHATMISSVGFLVYRANGYARAAFASEILLCTSALAAFSVVYQLFGQVGGLALGLAAIGLLTESNIYKPGTRIQDLIVTAIPLAGACAAYPEITPFVIVPSILFVFRGLVGRWLPLRALTLSAVALIGIVAALLNTYLVNFALVLFIRVLRTGKQSGADAFHLFPYYLVPTGLANLVGAYAIASFPAEPWLSLGIAVGIIFAGLMVYFAARLSIQNEPAGFALLFSAALGLFFFAKSSDFALYKLALYVQPFIYAAIGLAAFGKQETRVTA